MSSSGVDAVICLSPENFTYVSGFSVPSQSLMRWRHAAAVVSADGALAFLVVDMEESTVADKVNGSMIRSWAEAAADPRVLGEVRIDE